MPLRSTKLPVTCIGFRWSLALSLQCFGTLLVICLMAKPARATIVDRPEIRTDDVARFYALYDATGGNPTVEQIDNEYLKKGTESLREFAKLRRVTPQSIAERLNRDPSIYATAKECLAVLPAVKSRLAIAFNKLALLYPEARFPPVTIVVGRGRPVGITQSTGVTIGLEALCAADFI